MVNSHIAKRYAQAVFDLAHEQGRLDRIAEDLSALSTLLQHSRELEHFLADPLLSSERRSAVLSALFKGRFDVVSLNFILLLEEKHRIARLAEICRCFNELYYEHKGILKVDIVSAAALPAEQIQPIKDKLRTKFGRDIEVHPFVDPDLLGGFKIRITDLVLDFSLRSQLNRIKLNIINA